MDAPSLPPWCTPPRLAAPDGACFLLSGDDWAPTFCAYLDAAQHSIEIAQYCITTKWDTSPGVSGNVYAALRAARARGLTCRALLARHKQSSVSRNFNQFADIQMTGSGWIVRRAKPKNLLHSKLCIIDREHIILGSHNFTMAASISNIDLSILISGRELARSFVQWFETQWASRGEN